MTRKPTEEQVRDILGESALLKRALRPSLEGAPLGIRIMRSAQSMEIQDIAALIKEDCRYIREGAEGAWLAECEIRLALMIAELERREDGGTQQPYSGSLIHGEIFVASDGTVHDHE